MINIYFFNNKKQGHRKKGPAIISDYGYIVYYVNNKEHRINGPARMWPSGYNEYYLNGKRHKKNEYYEKLKH